MRHFHVVLRENKPKPLRHVFFINKKNGETRRHDHIRYEYHIVKIPLRLTLHINMEGHFTI